MSGSNLQRNEAFAINPYAPPSAPLEDVRRLQVAPPLWNPDAAANWSLLLTPAFGAYLHMRNWQVLGDSSKAAASRRWMIATVVLTCTLTVISALLPESQALTALVRAGSVALLFGWYFASAREQARYIKERYGTVRIIHGGPG
jgi:hypothetical protein